MLTGRRLVRSWQLKRCAHAGAPPCCWRGLASRTRCGRARAGAIVRSDTERNRRKLIKSAAFLVSRRGTTVKMADVAERAEVATATAYRHFSSVDEILAEYRYDVGLRLLKFSQKAESQGVALLADVSAEWVRLVVKHGRAMVHTRSDEGYLARLRSGARYLTVQAEALERPITEAAAELGIPDPGDEGTFLWNILFDPREIFDLMNTVGLSEEQVSRRLVAACCGSLQGWSTVAQR
ncbi:TetR/AcrR family transcriptional regulator [Saccharopolyspora sp. NPDC049357]|uniref:TetR/AcrR family transcriptional regulator n=1 Tax=Saccharopolyspora sp. NPDC049357 TaxID=3154507 RepID=UPI003412D7CE